MGGRPILRGGRGWALDPGVRRVNETRVMGAVRTALRAGDRELGVMFADGLGQAFQSCPRILVDYVVRDVDIRQDAGSCGTRMRQSDHAEQDR